MSFEKKLGEVFTWHDKKIEVVEQEGCEGCFFYDYYNCYEVIFATGPCCNRKDGKLVKFVELKRDKDE